MYGRLRAQFVKCLTSLSPSTVATEPAPKMAAAEGATPEATASVQRASQGYNRPGPWEASQPHKAHLGAGSCCRMSAAGGATAGSARASARAAGEMPREETDSESDARACAAGNTLGVRLGLSVTLPECCLESARGSVRGPPHPIVVFINGFQVCLVHVVHVIDARGLTRRPASRGTKLGPCHL